jgi:superfamily II DNA or RNA helicase
MEILIFDNNCQITNCLDEKVIHKIDNLLSFKVQGAEFSKAFKGYINERGEEVSWDGRKRLLTSDLRFPLGLLDKLKDFLNKNKLPFILKDQRKNTTPSNPVDIVQNLQSIGISPREYQINAANIAAQNYRGIIRAGTGAGKSAIAALVVANLGKSSIIYVIGTDLLYQFHGLFSKVFNEKIGMIGDGVCDIQRINIATIWSVGQALGLKVKDLDEDDHKEKSLAPDKNKAIKQMLLKTNVAIFDECHLAACETIQNISHFAKHEHFYGMSASPWRDDGQDMLIEAVLGRKLVDISAKYLVENGFLVKPTIRFLSVPKLEGKTKKHYQTIYSKYIIENEERNKLIVKGALKLVEQGFPTLVLFKNIKHGKLLFNELKKFLDVEFLSGEDSSEERE